MGRTLLWQKGLVSLETLEKHAVIKHCTDLMPFCVASRQKWLQALMAETLNKTGLLRTMGITKY